MASASVDRRGATLFLKLLALRESRRGRFVGLRLRVEGHPVTKTKPKTKRCSEMVLVWPKMAPRWPKKAPRWLKMGPR